MSTEALVMSHAAVFLAGLAGTWGYLRHIAGWSSAFETKVAAEFAHLKHLVGMTTAQVAPPQSPVAVAAPVATPVAGAAPSP